MCKASCSISSHSGCRNISANIQKEEKKQDDVFWINPINWLKWTFRPLSRNLFAPSTKWKKHDVESLLLYVLRPLGPPLSNHELGIKTIVNHFKKRKRHLYSSCSFLPSQWFKKRRPVMFKGIKKNGLFSFWSHFLMEVSSDSHVA